MRKINFLWLIGLLLLMPLGFTSCSNDDDEVGSASLLVGTWEIVSRTYQWKEDGKVVEEGSEHDNNSRITINEDGTYKVAEYYNGRWNWDEAGTWSYKNGKIMIRSTYEGFSRTVTVKELTSSQSLLEYIDKYIEDGISYEYYELSEYRKISE